MTKKRIDELSQGIDRTLIIENKNLSNNKNIFFSNNIEDLAKGNIFIITVPTPIYKNKKPDLRMLKNASKMVSKYLKFGDIVIYESTVYPGATEEVCVPILEEGSKLTFNKDFFCGYSPERINPEIKIIQLLKLKRSHLGK